MQSSNSMPGNAMRPLEIVTEVAKTHAETTALLIAASKEARANGHTYEQIGQASGTTRGTAWRRVNGASE